MAPAFIPRVANPNRQPRASRNCIVNSSAIGLLDTQPYHLFHRQAQHRGQHFGRPVRLLLSRRAIRATFPSRHHQALKLLFQEFSCRLQATMSMYPAHRGMGGVPPGNNGARLNELLEQVRSEFESQMRTSENYEHQSEYHPLSSASTCAQMPFFPKAIPAAPAWRLAQPRAAALANMLL